MRLRSLESWILRRFFRKCLPVTRVSSIGGDHWGALAGEAWASKGSRVCICIFFSQSHTFDASVGRYFCFSNFTLVHQGAHDSFVFACHTNTSACSTSAKSFVKMSFQCLTNLDNLQNNQKKNEGDKNMCSMRRLHVICLRVVIFKSRWAYCSEMCLLHMSKP